MTHHRTCPYPLLFLLLTLSFPHTHQSSQNPSITNFQAYLQINTAHPNPNYTLPITFLITQAQSLNLLTRTITYSNPSKPILLITWAGSNPNLKSIILNSHLDSVPAEPHKWSHPPFSATLTPSGKIFSRGAQDDKCISIQYLEAIKNLKEESFQPIRTVHLSYVPDEEIGGFDGAAKFVPSKEFEELNVGFALDEGQASVNDEYRVFYADRTPWHLSIKAVGPPGHGAKMFDNTAFENLMESVERVMRFREEQFEMVKRGVKMNSEVVSVNPVFLDAGIPTDNGYAMNMQPSEASAGFDIRMPPTADEEMIRRKIEEEWAPVSRNMTYEIVKKGVLRDHKGQPLMTATDDSNPWWSVFKQAIEAVGGKLQKPEILASTTDARFVRQRGIPTLGFSPMANTPILLHEHDEHLQDTVFLQGIKVYESLIRSLSSFEGP